MSLLSIKTCTFDGFPSPLRVVNENLIVAMDLMKSITLKDQNQATAILRNLSGDLFPQSKFTIMALPGQGNSKTKLVNFNDAALLVMVAPGKAAMKLRQTFADILTRVAAGDVSLISAMVANAKSSHPIALMARSSLSSAEPSSATISEQPERLAIKSSPSGSPGPASGAMFEDVPPASVPPPRKSRFEVMMGEMPAPSYDTAVERNILESERAKLQGVYANLVASFNQRAAAMHEKREELNARANELEELAQKNEKAGLALELHQQALDDREAKLNKLAADFETEKIALKHHEYALNARAADDIRDADANEARSKELDAREEEIDARARELEAGKGQLDARAEKLDAENRQLERRQEQAARVLIQNAAKNDDEIKERRQEVEARAKSLDLQAKELNECSEQLDARKADLDKREAEQMQFSGAVAVSSPIRKRGREADFARVTQAAEEWAKISKIGDLPEDAKRMFQERLLGFLETE